MKITKEILERLDLSKSLAEAITADVPTSESDAYLDYLQSAAEAALEW